MSVILGIDGGGTACRAWAAESPTKAPPSTADPNQAGAHSFQVVFRGQSGSANVATTAPQAFRDHLRKATQSCPTPDAVCGCFAGLLTGDDRARALDFLSEFFPTARLLALPDYAAAHAASNSDVTLVAGTGSVVCSRVDGKFVKTGGRGYLLGDVGSAFRYGREAFLARLPKADLERQSESIASIYRAPSPVAELAQSLSLFVADFKAGEAYACEFLEKEARALSGQLSEHLHGFHKNLIDNGGHLITVSLAGGVWKSSGVFQAALELGWQDFNLGVQVCFAQLKGPPVVGALRLAEELLEV